MKGRTVLYPFTNPPKRIHKRKQSQASWRHPSIRHYFRSQHPIFTFMCNSRPTTQSPQADQTPPEKEEEKHDPASLHNPKSKSRLVELFMHNPQFAKTFFEARIGEEGMNQFKALESHIQGMKEEELKVIMDSRIVGTRALLSQFFTPPKPSSIPIKENDNESGKEKDVEERREGEASEVKGRIKMKKWCWIFLGAWTVGEAGRVLEGRKAQSSHPPTIKSVL